MLRVYRLRLKMRYHDLKSRGVRRGEQIRAAMACGSQGPRALVQAVKEDSCSSQGLLSRAEPADGHAIEGGPLLSPFKHPTLWVGNWG